MKLELELPEWSNDRAIHVLAGIEHIAKREQGIWYVKDARCNLCGACCQDVPADWPHGQDYETGDCEHLVQEGPFWRCGLGTDRPYICCVSEGEEDECNITWR